MDANTVTAICATAIAVVSLTVSIVEARAARQHNRHSVRPLLELGTARGQGRPAAILLFNYGLGPAIITRTVLTVDGRPFGGWDEDDVNRLREMLPQRPSASTIQNGKVVPAGHQMELLLMPDYDYAEHQWFWDLIRQRIHLEIHYESLYGGEAYKVELNPPGRPGPQPTTR